MSELISTFFESFADFIHNSHDLQNDILSYLLQQLLNAFVYIFDLFIYEFTDLVFRNFDYSRIISTGKFTVSSLFSFTDSGITSSAVIRDNFIFFVIGLIALIFVFKLFFKLFLEVSNVFLGWLKSL